MGFLHDQRIPDSLPAPFLGDRVAISFGACLLWAVTVGGTTYLGSLELGVQMDSGFIGVREKVVLSQLEPTS
jgi:hypothetical protein